MDKMDESCKEAMNVVPLNSCYKPTDEVVNQILQQVIHCRCFIKSYCEGKSYSVLSLLKFICFLLMVLASTALVIWTLKNLGCSTAKQIQSYKGALVTFRAHLQGDVTTQIGIQMLDVAQDVVEVLKKLNEAGEISKAVHESTCGLILFLFHVILVAAVISTIA